MRSMFLSSTARPWFQLYLRQSRRFLATACPSFNPITFKSSSTSSLRRLVSLPLCLAGYAVFRDNTNFVVGISSILQYLPLEKCPLSPPSFLLSSVLLLSRVHTFSLHSCVQIDILSAFASSVVAVQAFDPLSQYGSQQGFTLFLKCLQTGILTWRLQYENLQNRSHQARQQTGLGHFYTSHLQHLNITSHLFLSGRTICIKVLIPCLPVCATMPSPSE
jgi:hypothetical protein